MDEDRTCDQKGKGGFKLHPNALDLTGQVFGRLRAIEPVGRRHRYIMWRCVCECGRETAVRSSCLVQGQTRSCGCLRDENPPPVMRGSDHPNWKGGEHIRPIISVECPGCHQVREVRIDHAARDDFTALCRACNMEQNHQCGEDHWNWRGGISSERDQVTATAAYKQWREAVYRRDGYQCCACGDACGGNLVAHHLASFSDAPGLRTAVDNGITLCRPCHRAFHEIFGYGHNTEAQLALFLETRGVV